MAPSDLTHLHTAPDEHPASRRGVPGAQSQTRHSVAPLEDLALAGHSGKSPDTERSRRASHHIYGVPSLDRQAVESPPHPGTPLRPSPPADRASEPLALHTQPRRLLERADRQWLLWWTPDDVRLGRPRRQRRPALAGAADASSGDRVPAFRLLAGVARRAVAKHIATVSRVSVRVTDRV